jgi:hypothetical protein
VTDAERALAVLEEALAVGVADAESDAAAVALKLVVCCGGDDPVGIAAVDLAEVVPVVLESVEAVLVVPAFAVVVREFVAAEFVAAEDLAVAPTAAAPEEVVVVVARGRVAAVVVAPEAAADQVIGVVVVVVELAAVAAVVPEDR